MGKGASIALHEGFRYQSLFEAAQLPSDAKELFSYLGTQDFEAVLRSCESAIEVTRAVGLDGRCLIESLQDQIRSALVKAIQAHHCQPGDIASRLPAFARFCRKFGKVVTLNYDLTLYWAMAESFGGSRYEFRDCFGPRGRYQDWRSVSEDGSTLVFYGHGSLILITDKGGAEQKVAVAAGARNLLEAIGQTWLAGSSPLFVCEGTSEQKRQAIRRSAYLSTVHSEVIPRLSKSVVVYGFGFNDNDDHVLERLAEGRPSRLRISVHNRDVAYALKVSKKIAKCLPGSETVFFRAETCPIVDAPTA